MRRLISLLTLTLIFLSSTAQQPLYTYFKWFKVEDGLPQSFISSLAQDQDGFLWIGTRDGLARYDGRIFRVFRHTAADAGSSSNVIQFLFCDSKNKLWILYENSPMQCFDAHTFRSKNITAFPLLDSVAKMGGWAFFLERNNVYLSLSPQGGLFATDLNRGTITRFSQANHSLSNDKILSTAEDKEGRLWLYHTDGLEVSDRSWTTFRYIPFPSSVKFNSSNRAGFPPASYPITCLPDGRMIMGDVDKLILYDNVTNSFQEIPCGMNETGMTNEIRQMMVGADGLLYLEKMGNIFRMEKNGQFTYLWKYPGKEFNYAQNLLLDRSNVLWFGTNAAGLYKVDFASLPFTSSEYDGKFHTAVISKIPGINNSMLPAVFLKAAASYHFRYTYENDGSLFFSDYSDDMKENSPICYFKNNKIGSLALPVGRATSFEAFGVDKTGSIFGTDPHNFLYRWNKPGEQPSVKHLEGITEGAIMDMEPDDEGGFWAVTEGSGLYHFKNDTLVHRYSSGNKNDHLPPGSFTDLVTDPENKNWLWIGTLGQGLILFDKNSGGKKVLTTDDGLPNNTIYAIVPDDEGRLWLSTNKGICLLNKKNYSVKNFDVTDGLPENEFNRFHSFKFPDGRIAFGGSNGYTIFDPAKFTEDTFSTAVQITGFSVNNQRVEFGDPKKILSQPINELAKLVLPYNKNFLSFEFSGLQFNQPGKIQYRYMLKGYDKDWVNAGQRNLANYTKLPPGHYTLLLNASNTSGRWSPDVKELSIRIKPPFWGTWWAYTIYVLLALWLVRIYFRYRAKRLQLQNEIALEQSKSQYLKEVDEIKNRFFSNITHELRTPLTLILTPLEKLKQENTYSPADQRILSNAHKNAGQLLRLINQLLDISKIESGQMKVNVTAGDLNEFVERCCQQFSLQAKEKNIQLRFSNDSVVGNYLFDEEKWEKIVFNLLSNAIKFTPQGGEVAVELADNNGIVQLTVSDTGAGIREEDIQKIFDRFYMADDSATRKQSGTGIGLSLVKELAELMKGKIEVKSVYGQGSTFIVEIPIEKTVDKVNIRTEPAERIIAATETDNKIITEEKKEGPLVLVVEDNEELRSFLVESLSPNWRVIQAASGKLGWEIILQELPDLIISDLMMPGMDGFELCQLVKDDVRTGHISFILLTAKAAHESRLTGLKKGADEYLTKPFHFDELEQRLQNLVQQQERLRKHLQKELLPEVPLRKLPHVNDLFIQELYKQLDEKIDDPNMSVDVLAKSMNMSQRTLNRKLKAILNISPIEFIRQYRLQKAAVMLAAGHGIADTAYTVGFETASYFTQCFKEQFGKTPTEFANQKTA